MKMIFGLVIVTATLITGLANADAFDDKAAAAAQAREQAAEAQAQQKRFNAVTSDNTSIVRRIPRGSSNVQCFDRDASWYRKEQNGCNLGQSSWNGIPVEVCEETYRYNSNSNLPPPIVECHYHLANGKDCQIYLNASLGATCL